MNALDFVSHYFFRTTRYLDYAAIFIYGRKPGFWWDTLLALLVEITFNCTLTLFFIYLLPHLKTGNYLFKGVFFGGSCWFIINVFGIVFRVPLLYRIPWQTTTSDLLTSAIFGFIVIITIRRLYQGKEEWSEAKT
jgi:hypothetical protein